MQEEKAKKQYGLGRIAFKSRLQEIQRDVDEGFPLTTIYEKYKESMGITYSQFARHAQRFIQKEGSYRSTKPELSRPEAPEAKPTLTKATLQADTPFREKFEFNPVAPDYDDLI